VETGEALRARIAGIVAELAPPVVLAERSRANQALFDDRAPWYETGAGADSYLSPAGLERLIAKHLHPDGGPVLDLACGTGLMGECLRRLGFSDLWGCDLSLEMLEAARGKRLYKDLRQADLHRPLPYPTESFAAVICAGTFFADIVAAEALAQVLPVIRPGGWLICDVELTAWDAGGFGAVLGRLRDLGLLSQLETEEARMFAPGVVEDVPDAGCSSFARFVAARRT